MKRRRNGMTWTLALLGAGAVAYGVTKSVNNRKKTDDTEEVLPFSPDMPAIF